MKHGTAVIPSATQRLGWVSTAVLRRPRRLQHKCTSDDVFPSAGCLFAHMKSLICRAHVKSDDAARCGVNGARGVGLTMRVWIRRDMAADWRALAG
jgi:hypothetical protein